MGPIVPTLGQSTHAHLPSIGFQVSEFGLCVPAYAVITFSKPKRAVELEA